jgi:hypothetical protein
LSFKKTEPEQMEEKQKNESIAEKQKNESSSIPINVPKSIPTGGTSSAVATTQSGFVPRMGF